MDKIDKVYVLDCATMNGTVKMNSNYTGYASRELAEEAAEAVNKANDNNGYPFDILTSISEMPIYFTREDVPILNGKENK